MISKEMSYLMCCKHRNDEILIILLQYCSFHTLLLSEINNMIQNNFGKILKPILFSEEE